MPKRHILLTIHSLLGGGAERVMALLASDLARAGHDVTLCVDEEADGNAGLLDPAVRVVILGRSHAGGIRALARILRKERPDVSLSAVGLGNLKHVAAALLAGRADRAVIAFHGFLEAEPQPLARLSNLISPVTTRLSAASVYVSDALMADYRRRLFTSARRGLRIHNPVMTEAARAAPDEAALRAREPVICALGRLDPIKDMPVLVEALALMRRRDARLVILGEGEDRARIESAAKAHGVAERVSLPGYVAAPWTHLAQAACLASASRSESFGNTLVEGLAHGLPVVSTDCGGPREILDGGRFGALVPVGDAPALARALDAALDDPGDPSARVARAGAFTRARALAAYEALVERICASAASPTGRA